MVVVKAIIVIVSNCYSKLKISKSENFLNCFVRLTVRTSINFGCCYLLLAKGNQDSRLLSFSLHYKAVNVDTFYYYILIILFICRVKTLHYCSRDRICVPYKYTHREKQRENSPESYFPHPSRLPQQSSRYQYQLQPSLEETVPWPEKQFTGHSPVTSSRAYGPWLNTLASGTLLWLNQHSKLSFSWDQTRNWRWILDGFTSYRSHEIQSKIH